MRRLNSLLLPVALIALLLSSPAAFAQLIPWSEPPALEDEKKVSERPKPPLRRAARTAKTALDEADLKIPSSAAEVHPLVALVQIFSASSSSLALSSFDNSASSGSVRSGTSWVGNITQNATSITVAGTAADDNGWGASHLALDATGMNFLTITAQRDAGNLTPTLFVQFEDRSSRTKVFSVSTSLFAVGTLTTVQVPLTGWTIDFGANDISAWSLGGGNVGTTAFRLTIDEFALTASAIPEPTTYAALLGAAALTLAAWRRRRGHAPKYL